MNDSSKHIFECSWFSTAYSMLLVFYLRPTEFRFFLSTWRRKKSNWIEKWETFAGLYFFRFHQLNINHWDMNLYIVEANLKWETHLWKRKFFFLFFFVFFLVLNWITMDLVRDEWRKNRGYWAVFQRLGHFFFRGCIEAKRCQISCSGSSTSFVTSDFLISFSYHELFSVCNDRCNLYPSAPSLSTQGIFPFFSISHHRQTLCFVFFSLIALKHLFCTKQYNTPTKPRRARMKIDLVCLDGMCINYHRLSDVCWCAEEEKYKLATPFIRADCNKSRFHLLCLEVFDCISIFDYCRHSRHVKYRSQILGNEITTQSVTYEFWFSCQ